MSDISAMSDDDRERVVRSRFEELMTQYLNGDIGKKWFDERVKAMTEAAGGTGTPPPPPTRPASQPAHTSGRVSAFEKFLLGR